jgi:plasmid stabilization system protein ParE
VNLQFVPAVVTDIEKSVRYYRKIQVELAAKFRESFNVSVEAIRRRPGRFPVIFDGHRRALLRSFPYAIYFKIDNEEIFVVLVIHSARRPQRAAALLRKRKIDS